VKHYFRTIVGALAISLMGSALVPALKADEWDKRTSIKIDQSIDVQGTVLPPGSYVIKLLGLSPDRYTVQIFNADENHIITTVFATAAYRPTGTGDSEFKFYEVADGQPPALRTWFYPGDIYGFEFELRPGRTDVAVKSGPRPAKATTSTAAGN
jgi:hypothetical protein